MALDLDVHYWSLIDIALRAQRRFAPATNPAGTVHAGLEPRAVTREPCERKGLGRRRLGSGCLLQFADRGGCAIERFAVHHLPIGGDDRDVGEADEPEDMTQIAGREIIIAADRHAA